MTPPLDFDDFGTRGKLFPDPESELEMSQNGLFGSHCKLSCTRKSLRTQKKVSFFFQKLKIFAYCCHEKTLVIPQNEKRDFAKHGFTTEFSCRNTTFSTEIPTVLGV